MKTKVTEDKKVWFITGTSSGFGRRTAEEALQRGHYVVATARNTDDIEELNKTYSDRVMTLPLDVTKPDTISEAFEKAIERHGRIDVLMNNAGYSVAGAIEETSDEEARRQFDVNVFGLLNVTRAALPILRKQNDGMIINISSMVGLVAFGAMGIYSSSKFAVEGISEALSQELSPLGIRVMLVEPGAFDTSFSDNLSMAENKIEDYKELRESLMDEIEFNGDPDKAAKAIVAAATSPTPPARLLLGDDAVDGVNKKLHFLHENIDKWEPVSRSTKKSDDGKIREKLPV